MSKLLAEKDEQIKQLMKEGEALSLKILEFESLIKKLKSQKKDSDDQNERFSKTIETLNAEGDQYPFIFFSPLFL